MLLVYFNVRLVIEVPEAHQTATKYKIAIAGRRPSIVI